MLRAVEGGVRHPAKFKTPTAEEDRESQHQWHPAALERVLTLVTHRPHGQEVSGEDDDADYNTVERCMLDHT